jgi:hypothetical protein
MPLKVTSMPHILISQLKPMQNDGHSDSEVDVNLPLVNVGPWRVETDNHGNHTFIVWQLKHTCATYSHRKL